MIEAGLNMARLNFSHGTHEEHQLLLDNIRTTASKCQKVVAILQDLQGPRIRVGDIGKKPRMLKNDEAVIITTGKVDARGLKIPITYDKLHQEAKAGHRILMVDGLISLMVEKVTGRDLHCRVMSGGEINTHKGVNLPDTAVTIPALTAKDKEDLLFGVKNNVDYCALSFVRCAKDVIELRNLIHQYEKRLRVHAWRSIGIIVKIERKEAIDNLEEIIEAADGVMVARGDLGIELPPEDVPLMQKMIIDRCLAKAKPVIVATQMLDSMIVNPRPTRAEVSDVANAVIDHADALMLSGETANGKYPVDSVAIMRRVIEKTESSAYDNLVVKNYTKKIEPTSEAIGRIANILASSIKARAIIVSSLSGESGRIVSRYRPELPIFVACSELRVQRQLQLSWGVRPFVMPLCDNVEELIEGAVDYLKKSKSIKAKDKVIIITGEPVGISGNVNLIEIKDIQK